MAQLCEFKLKSGGTVIVEVEDAQRGATKAVSGSKLLTAAGRELADTLQDLGPFMQELMTALTSGPARPASIQATFGFKLSAKGKVIVAEAAAEGNVSVTLGWSAPK